MKNLVLAMLFLGAAYSATRQAPEDYATIQAAIDAPVDASYSAGAVSGDVSGDSIINVIDIVALVNIIINQ